MGAVAAPLPPPAAASQATLPPMRRRQCDGAANQAGSTKQNDSTTSPLADALVLKDKFIMLLQIMSQPFLQPLSTSMLSEFTTAYYYYAEAKHKSDQNYVSLNLSRV